jgi:hypothetical protein
MNAMTEVSFLGWLDVSKVFWRFLVVHLHHLCDEDLKNNPETLICTKTLISTIEHFEKMDSAELFAEVLRVFNHVKEKNAPSDFMQKVFLNKTLLKSMLDSAAIQGNQSLKMETETLTNSMHSFFGVSKRIVSDDITMLKMEIRDALLRKNGEPHDDRSVDKGALYPLNYVYHSLMKVQLRLALTQPNTDFAYEHFDKAVKSAHESLRCSMATIVDDHSTNYKRVFDIGWCLSLKGDFDSSFLRVLIKASSWHQSAT